MAADPTAFTVETDAITDGARDLGLIADRLPGRHGERFRDYERRLQRTLDEELVPQIQDLGEAILIATLPPKLSAMIGEARALGII